MRFSLHPGKNNSLRYFFHIGYNGFLYQGWQKLPQANSVQSVIEKQLSQILKVPVSVVGCGRTDTKVHASQFFFHVDLRETWDYDLVFRLNKNLPDDITVFDIIPVADSAHARLDAVSRTYTYFIHTYKDPYLAPFSALYPLKLDLNAMSKAVELLPKYTDYHACCRNTSVHRTTICHVTSAALYVNQTGEHIRFEISANRFLNGMIRIIVKKLLQIGAGKLSVAAFEHQIRNKETVIVKGAYPQGLYLSKVTYPFLEMPSRSELFNALVKDNRWKAVR